VELGSGNRIPIFGWIKVDRGIAIFPSQIWFQCSLFCLFRGPMFRLWGLFQIESRRGWASARYLTRPRFVV
jgi:hypothetical protein